MSALEGLLEELGVDLTNEQVQLSIRNYRDERDHLQRLRELRESHRLTPDMVSRRIGMSAKSVRELEGWDSDVTLARLRRYVLAVGATTTVTVRDASRDPEPSC